MERELLDSSSVASAGYDEARRMMEVEFVHGGVYVYLDVEPDLYRRFREAESHGRFLNAEIKPHHPFLRLHPAHR